MATTHLAITLEAHWVGRCSRRRVRWKWRTGKCRTNYWDEKWRNK